MGNLLSKVINYSLIVLVLLLGAVFGKEIIEEKGKVLVEYAGYVIEFSFLGLLIFSFFGFLMVLAIASIVRKIWRVSSGTGTWLSGRKVRKANEDLKYGLLAMVENNWDEAHKRLSRSAEHSEFSAIHYLAAADAAERLNDNAKAVEYRQKAELLPEAFTASQIRQLRAQLAEGKAKEVNQKASELLLDSPKHRALVLIKVDALNQLQDWLSLLTFLDEKKSVFDKKEFEDLQRSIYLNCFAQVSTTKGVDGLKSFWKELPRKLKSDTAQISAYSEQLIAHGDHETAQGMILSKLKKSPDVAMLIQLRKLTVPQPLKLISQLEQWIKQQPDNVQLVTALGFVAANSRDFGLAKKALQKSVELQPDPSVLAKLAEVCEQLEQPQQALEYYKQGMSIKV